MLSSAGAHQGLSTLSNTGEPPPLSLDLPQNISQLLSLPQQASAPMPHSYKDGGMIGKDGKPIRPNTNQEANPMYYDPGLPTADGTNYRPYGFPHIPSGVNPSIRDTLTAKGLANATGEQTPSSIRDELTLRRLQMEREIEQQYGDGGYATTPQPPTGYRAYDPNLPYKMWDYRKPSYEMGGQVGAGGVPMRPPSTMTSGAALLSNSGQPNGNNIGSVQDSVAQNPMAAQQIRQQIEQGIQSGDITPQELNMFISMAQMSMQNPNMYPQLRQNLLGQGLPEDALPPQFEQAEGILTVIATMGSAMQSAPQGSGAPSAAMQPPQASYEQGGALPAESKNADGSIPITAHEGEYVATKEALAYHGRKTYEKLEEQAKNPNGKGATGGT